MRRLLSVLLFGVLVSVGMGPATPQSTGDLFEEHQVVLGNAKHQTVLTGFFLGSDTGTVTDAAQNGRDAQTAQLAVVSVDRNDDRSLCIYGFGDSGDDKGTEPRWAPRLDATLSPEVLLVDVANIGGQDRLITYARNRVNWFDPESATERPLVALQTVHEAPPKGPIRHADLTRDINGDGRDDLLVPDFGGFWVVIQLEGGEFAQPLKLGPADERHRIYGASGFGYNPWSGTTAGSDGYRYDPWSQGRLRKMDYDRDGRSDLVFWHRDHFEVHRQNEHGLFSPVAETFTTDVAFQADGLYSLVLGDFGDERTGLHSLGDLNGDGVADLVTLSPEGASFRTTWSRALSLVLINPSFEVHYGTPVPDGTVFARNAQNSIRSEGVQFGMRQHDFDRDGQMDIMFTNGRYSFPKLVRALLTGSVPLKLEFYRMEGGVYSDKPNATRTIRVDSPPRRRRSYPTVLIGDVNGDQRSDLLIQRGRKALQVFMGVSGPDLFAQQPRKVAVKMPADEEYTRLVDLNKDGKQDVLLHQAPTEQKPAEPHRLTLLIAR